MGSAAQLLKHSLGLSGISRFVQYLTIDPNNGVSRDQNLGRNIPGVVFAFVFSQVLANLIGRQSFVKVFIGLYAQHLKIKSGFLQNLMAAGRLGG
jgi:hypothetical protein